MHALLAVPRRPQSQGEEIANRISHGVALLAALVGTPYLILPAERHGDARFVVGASIFAATMILLYLSSMLYHALRFGKAKRIFRVIEHFAIFLLIAGKYTPFTLGVLRGAWDWTLFGLVWFFALTGVALKVFRQSLHHIISTPNYLMTGWLVVIAVDPMISRIPTAGLLWLIAHGASYTAGVVFFALDSRLKYGHLIRHLFAMAGTTAITSRCSGMRPAPLASRLPVSKR